MSAVAQATPLDAWIINHFKVLPTDERFIKLTERQKVYLFYTYLEFPTDEQLHKVHSQAKTVPQVTKDDIPAFTDMGYSPAQIRQINKDLKNA